MSPTASANSVTIKIPTSSAMVVSFPALARPCGTQVGALVAGRTTGAIRVENAQPAATSGSDGTHVRAWMAYKRAPCRLAAQR